MNACCMRRGQKADNQKPKQRPHKADVVNREQVLMFIYTWLLHRLAMLESRAKGLPRGQEIKETKTNGKGNQKAVKEHMG